MTIRATSGTNEAEQSRSGIPADWLTGGLALVAHNGEIGKSPPSNVEIAETGWNGKTGSARGGNARFWFRNWKVMGGKLREHPERAFGPILFTMQTLSRQTLKLTAQMAPVGNVSRTVYLEIEEGGVWKRIAESTMDPDARTATFKVEAWDDSRDIPYRVNYPVGETDHTYEGVVRKDPHLKESIVVAAFTGNNDLGFPHADVVRNVSSHSPDFLAYTGDNIYERVGEYGIQREPVDAAILDYLRKWYIFGWEYGDLLKDIPAVALPDDHDVYQGNVWGAGGRHAEPIWQRGPGPGGLHDAGAIRQRRAAYPNFESARSARSDSHRARHPRRLHRHYLWRRQLRRHRGPQVEIRPRHGDSQRQKLSMAGPRTRPTTPRGKAT